LTKIHMREKLKAMGNIRTTFTGVFVRMGLKSGYKGQVQTVLLRDIKNAEGVPMADHLWFNHTKGFEELAPLYIGDNIRFDARVLPYIKGYCGRRDVPEKPPEQDFKLSRPTKITITNTGETIGK